MRRFGFQSVFEFEECVGVIGGRPNHALYFIGCVDEELLSLDPHDVTQTSGVVRSRTTQEDLDIDATFHTERCHRINLQQVDPSLSLVSLFFFNKKHNFGFLST